MTRCVARAVEMQERLANSHAGNFDRTVRGRSFVNLGFPGTTCGSVSAFARMAERGIGGLRLAGGEAVEEDGQVVHDGLERNTRSRFGAWWTVGYGDGFPPMSEVPLGQRLGEVDVRI